MAADIPSQTSPNEKRVQKRSRVTGLRTLFEELEDKDNGGVPINPAPKRPIFFKNPNLQQPQIPALPPTPEATQRLSRTAEIPSSPLELSLKPQSLDLQAWVWRRAK
jgi:hypothetical protein